jgi:hypothetical protein
MFQLRPKMHRAGLYVGEVDFDENEFVEMMVALLLN